MSLVKLLGVLIDDNLSFNEHVSKLCVKAARQTNALRRIVKYIPNECRLNIYQAFISSNFNYCDTVWHFCSNRSTYKIEKVHKNALRVTLNNFNSDTMKWNKHRRPFYDIFNRLRHDRHTYNFNTSMNFTISISPQYWGTPCTHITTIMHFLISIRTPYGVPH